MAAYVRGSKRLKIIQNYLNGKEDDEYEVLLTKKERKYIVKKRTEPLIKKEATKHVSKVEATTTSPETSCSRCLLEKENIPAQAEESKNIPKTITQQPIYKASNSLAQSDPTISIEILNQLKLLGEEIKSKREKKEQKRMIKEVVQKQLLKQPKEYQLDYNYTQPQNIQEPKKVEQTEEEQYNNIPPIIRSQPMRRRNNIFSDIYIS